MDADAEDADGNARDGNPRSPAIALRAPSSKTRSSLTSIRKDRLVAFKQSAILRHMDLRGVR